MGAILRILSWIVGTLVVLWLSFKTASALYMVGYIPEKFGLAPRYSEGACVSNFFGYMGAFAVGLDAKTVQAIEKKGIGFFADIGGPRAVKRRIYFEKWAETPVPAKAFSNGMPAHLHCGSQYGWFWPIGLREALEAPGSYYSDGLEGRSAVVVPSKSLIVISMQSR